MDFTDAEQQTRRERLRAWLAEHGGHAKVVRDCRLTPSQASYLSQLANGYSFGPRAARNFERRLGMPAKWLDADPGWMPNQHLSTGEPPPRWAGAQDLSLVPFRDSPLIAWGEVMQKLPPRFRVAAPDDSMAPRVRAGDVLEFDTQLQPRAGDGVLVRDDAGNLYFRLYRERRPGHWQAVPVNEAAFDPLDSAKYGLQVVAVMTAVFQRWG